MLVRCIKTTEKSVPLVLPRDIQLPLGEANYCSSGEHFTIDAAVDGYSLSCKKVYPVYGLLTANGRLRYLMADDDNIPGFFALAWVRTTVSAFSKDPVERAKSRGYHLK